VYVIVTVRLCIVVYDSHGMIVCLLTLSQHTLSVFGVILVGCCHNCR